MMGRYEIVEINTYDDILSTIERFDSIFSPSLSRRVSDLHKYALKLEGNAIVYVANYTETIGFIAFYVNNSEYVFVTLIAILEQHQKSGIGRALIEKCFEVSRNLHIGKVRLEVLKDNAQAIKFYENLGFNIVDDLDMKSYYMERNIMYGK